jgi:hypothetical protein
LCLEGLLKLVDIVVDAAIQIARLVVWVVAIAGVLIVVTLMTNTTDKFIDLLNSSIFPIVGLETKIQKVGPTDPVITLPGKKPANTVLEEEIVDDTANLESSVTDMPRHRMNNQASQMRLRQARQELIKARRARAASTETIAE